MSTDTVWNVPNRISAARLFLAFVVFALIPAHFYFAALIVFIVAAGTDWVDGWYARKYNQVTQLGRILDPFCDKILICGVFILVAVEMNGVLPWYMSITGWIAVVVTGRELLVTVLRSLIEGAGGDFSAKMAGKLKMWFQCIAAGAALYALHVAVGQAAADQDVALPVWLIVVLVVSIWASLISTIHSGILYVFAAKKYLMPQSES